MRIKNIYYTIWADLIIDYRKRKPDISEKALKKELLTIISIVNAINIRIFIFILYKINILKIETIHLSLLPSERINYGLSFIIQYFVPLVVLNYLLVFRKNRYLTFIDKYQTSKNNSGKIYVISVLVFANIALIIYGLISDNLFKV